MTDIERLKAIRGKLLRFIDHHDVEDPTIEEFLKIVEELIYLKGDRVPVGWEVCSPEWCDRHNACHEAPRIWFESDGTGQHYHPSSPSLSDYCKQAAETVREWPKWKQDGADVTKGGPL